MTNSHESRVPSSDQSGGHESAWWNPLVGPAGSPGSTARPDLTPPSVQPPGHEAGVSGHPPPSWVAPTPVYPYAAWIRRVGAYLIDFAPAWVALIPFYVGYGMLAASLIRYTIARPSNPDAAPPDVTGTPLVLVGVGVVLLLAALGWQWRNRWLTAGRTGQSMGKRVLNTKLVAEVNGQPIGPVNAFLRDVLHVLDGIACIGFLCPLWDAKRQTFADMIMKTVVTDLRVQSAADPVGHRQIPVGAA